MEPLLAAQPELLAYAGKGCSLGFIGHSALHWCAAKGYSGLARWLIAQGAPLAQRNNAESTALHTAAQNGQSAVAQLLLDAGADVALTDADGKTARDVALERGHAALARALELGAGRAAGREALGRLAASDVWKVSDMKVALKANGVDVSSVTEKPELVRMVQELLENSPPPPAAHAPTTASSKPPADTAHTPPPAEPPEKTAAAGHFFGAGVKAAVPAEAEDSDDDDASAKGAERARAAGNEAFGKGAFDEAIKHFGLAIRLDPKNHLLYSNRSAARASVGKAQEALEDAEKCVSLNPQFAKGYSRQGAALVLLGKYKEAMRAYKKGLEIEPSNAGLLKGLDDLRASLRHGELPAAEGVAPATSASASATATEAPPKAAAKARAVDQSQPPGQLWIEAAKRGDRAEMEAILAQEGPSVVHYKARGIGHTAMHWCASRGEVQLMVWLLSLGAEVNARNTSEATPLHTAAGNGQAMSVEFLLARGADRALKNDDGATAADLAKRKGREDLARAITTYEPGELEGQAGRTVDRRQPATDTREEEVD